MKRETKGTKRERGGVEKAGEEKGRVDKEKRRGKEGREVAEGGGERTDRERRKLNHTLTLLTHGQ